MPCDALAAYVRSFAHTPDSVRACGTPEREENLKGSLEAPQAQDGERDLEEEKDWEGERESEGKQEAEDVASRPGRGAAGRREESLCHSELREESLWRDSSVGRGACPERVEGLSRNDRAVERPGVAEPAEARLAYRGVRLAITARQDALLAAAFPWVERPAEYRKMESWLEANPLRRPRSASRFVHNWFAKIEAPSSSSGQSPRPVPVEARVGRGPQGLVRVRPEYLEQLRQRAESRTQNLARASPASTAAASPGSPRAPGAALKTE